MPSATEPRTYTEKEVAEILKRAMAQGLRPDGLTHDDLVEMACELDIDQHALEAACADVARGKAEELETRTLNEELSAERTRCFFSFLSSLVTYLVVGAGLYLVNTRYFPGEWFHWVLAIWGVVLMFKLRSVISPERSLEKRKKRELKRAAREQRRLEREQWRQRLRAAWSPSAIERKPWREGMRPEWSGSAHNAIVEQSAKQFEVAVQNGVAALLSLAARKIEAHLEDKAKKGREPGGRP
jgi:hypothetical protein